MCRNGMTPDYYLSDLSRFYDDPVTKIFKKDGTVEFPAREETPPDIVLRRDWKPCPKKCTEGDQQV